MNLRVFWTQTFLPRSREEAVLKGSKMLHHIVKKFEKEREKIEAFFSEHTQGLKPPLYLSCDIRNSGRKIGVIDTNLFPAGFNNLCNAYSRVTTVAFKNYFDQYYPNVKKMILLSEEHTRNRYYLENIHRLYTLLQSTGIEVRVGFIGTQIKDAKIEVPLSDERILILERLKTSNGTPQLPGFEADLIISNNDFSQSLPEELLSIQNKILPYAGLGWEKRRKSHHFELLQKWIEKFANHIELDPWLLSCYFDFTSQVDLSNPKDLEALAEKTQKVLNKIEASYHRYDISDSAYAFIKNNSGTYGMGLLDISQSDEIRQMNRRTRNKLLSSKGGGKIHSFLIQEGIPTADFYSGLPIEPVIYMVGFKPVGGFFRMNPERDAVSSLNTRGMIFSCLCLHKIEEPHEDNFLNCAEKENLVKLSSIMARLAALAAAEEYQEVGKSNQ